MRRQKHIVNTVVVVVVVVLSVVANVNVIRVYEVNWRFSEHSVHYRRRCWWRCAAVGHTRCLLRRQVRFCRLKLGSRFGVIGKEGANYIHKHIYIYIYIYSWLVPRTLDESNKLS